MVDDTSRRRVLRGAAGLAAGVLVAGCSGGGSDVTATGEPSLTVAEFVFCDEQPGGYDDYTPREDATYRLDETVWVYLDVLNLDAESAGEDAVTIDLTEHLEVVGPDGDTVLENEIDFDNEFPADADLQTFFLVNDITLPGDAPSGDYEVRVGLTDHVADDSTETSGTFTVEA